MSISVKTIVKATFLVSSLFQAGVSGKALASGKTEGIHALEGA